MVQAVEASAAHARSLGSACLSRTGSGIVASPPRRAEHGIFGFRRGRGEAIGRQKLNRAAHLRDVAPARVALAEVPPHTEPPRPRQAMLKVVGNQLTDIAACWQTILLLRLHCG
jgi:hypothetical protein